ncbi:tripartite motif-containing 13 [Patella vulgata]|uniref:tripartite motif-containing 13 n=1 Tax=Patella vulgata TaxID=6465 RepID=UPI00217F3650|nr:tripartite motif-containing 13 [Patella vulgata]
MANELNSFSCSICLNEFNKPKIIDCHHTFCESCLANYVANAVVNNEFLCPLCRKEITVPDGGVKAFPVNFYITDTPQISCQQPVERQQTSRHMCTLHLRERELFCCNCCEAVCIKCFISEHPGHFLETVHVAENILIGKLTLLREDIQANILKYQEMLAPPTKTVLIKLNGEWLTLSKEESKAWLCEVIRESEVQERRISTILGNCNLSDMLDENREFGLIMDNELHTAVGANDVKLDRRDELNSSFRLRDEISHIPPIEDGVHSSELDINLLPQSLRGDIVHTPEPGQSDNCHGNTMVHSFDVTAIGRVKKLLTSPTCFIGGELWSLGCICDYQHRKAPQLRISLKRITSNSSSLFARFTVVLSGRTKSRKNENEFYFTPHSNCYKWSDSRMKYGYISNPANGYVNHDNKITITVIFHQFMVNRTPSSGITSSREPMRYTPNTESENERSLHNRTDRYGVDGDIHIVLIRLILTIIVFLLYISVAPYIYLYKTCTMSARKTFVAILCIFVIFVQIENCFC